ncbi:TPA: glycosyltransferase [Photobacterium damselae]
MRILQLSKFYKPYSGGLETVVADISEGVSNNHEVTVLATDNSDQKTSEKINEVNILRSKEWFSFASVSFAPKYIINYLNKVKEMDIIHVHLPNPLANFSIFLGWFLFYKPKKIVVHWHSDIIKQKTILKYYKPFQNWLLKKSDIIIVTSSNYLEYSEQLEGFKHKCQVIPIGIHSIEKNVKPKLVESIRQKYLKDNEDILIFSLGRHIYYKGFEYLLESMIDIDHVKLIIGGSGPDTQKYKNYLNRYNLNEKVFFIGRVSEDELPSFYAAADIFCFPSIEKSEAFGVVQLESMSVGTPIISTNIKGSGVPWVNKDKISGIICEPKSSSSLNQALYLLKNNPSLRKSLATGAKDRYLSSFTADSMNKKILDVYKSIS